MRVIDGYLTDFLSEAQLRDLSTPRLKAYKKKMHKKRSRGEEITEFRGRNFEITLQIVQRIEKEREQEKT
jgi:hypothetical protein